MAAPKENTLSLGRGIGTEKNIFKKQRERSQNNSTSVLQHLEELKKREFAAKLHNRQLLQQFEEAQDTLRSMLTLTASMRTIRMEYERYLESERLPLRQQQLWEKRRAAQRKKNTSDDVLTAPADQMLTSQAYYNQDRSSNLNYTPSPWLSCLHPQSRFPVSAPPQPYQLQQLASLTGQNDKDWPSQNAPDQASLQSDHPWSWLAGNQSAPDAMWEQHNMEDTCVEKEELQTETSGQSSSKTERCTSRSCSSHLSQELDDKPVRLSDIPTESSSESSQVSSSRRKEKRASSRTSSDRKGSISQDSSKASSVTITAIPYKVSQKSDNSISSEEGISRSTRRRKKGGHTTKIERNKRTSKDTNREEVEEAKEEKVQSKSNKGKRSEEKSGAQEEEKPKSSSENFKNVGGDLGSSSEEVSAEEDEAEEEQQKPPRREVKDWDSDENVDGTDEVQEKLKTEDTSERQTSTDEEGMQQEEEMEEQESDKEGDQVEHAERLSDDRKRSWPSTSPQVEKECEGQTDGGEGTDEEREELDHEGEASEEGEEQDGGESDQAEEESSSDDSIISPQSRSKELHNTQGDKVEYEVEDEEEDDNDEGSASRKSEDSSDDSDIEKLLAPQEQMLEEQEEKETTKAFCKVQSFQVKAVDLAKTDDPCDFDEYDDFYD